MEILLLTVKPVYSGHLYLTDTFLGTKPENYSQTLIKKDLCRHLYIADTFLRTEGVCYIQV